MPRYLPLELDALNADELQQNALDEMQAQAPAGWVPNSWLLWLTSAIARMAVLVLTLAGQVPQQIFQAFGEKVLRIPLVQATAATGNLQIAATAGLGGTLAAGAAFDIDGVAFQSSAPITLAAGATGTVAVQAIATGSAATGLVGTSIVLTSPSVIWVQTLTLTAPTIGGTDGETPDEYVDRLPDEIPTLSPKVVLISDASAIARRDPEVARALAINNFVPPSTTGVPGAITIALMAAGGSDVSEDAKDRVEASVGGDGERILNIDVHVIDPTRTAIKVAFTAQCYPDQDPATMAATAKQAIEEFLAPASWGIPPGGDLEDWVDEAVVVRNDLIGVLYRTGLRHVSDLTLALLASALDDADVTLAGPAAVPTITSSDITATVTT
jgi:hypothetical protein